MAAASAAVIASFCGALSLLSLSAAVIALPANDTIDRLREKRPVTDAEAKEAADRSLRAAGIFEDGRYLSNAALAMGQLPVSSQYRDGADLRETIDSALRSEPASPHNWARRAALQLKARDLSGARASIDTSILMGRFVPGLTVPRLAIMVEILKRQPDQELFEDFGEQARIAARIEAGQLAALADGGAAEGMTHRALLSDIQLYSSYLAALQAHRRNKAEQAAGPSG